MKRIVLYFVPALCLLASCSRERGMEPASGAESREVVFKFSTSTRGASRASVVDDAIYTLDVLLFQRAAPTDPESLATYVTTRYAWQSSGNTWRTNLPVGSGYDIYYAVNAHALVDGLVAGATPAITAGMTYGDASKLLLLDTPGVNIGANGLPMWGYLYNKSVADVPLNDFGTVYLLRSVASTDVSVLAADFTLEQGILCYAADRGYLRFSPANTTAAPGGGYQANTPEVPATMTSVATPDWVYDVTTADANAVTGVFYIYENDAPPATAQRSSTKVILKGVWNNPAGSGLPTYYPLAIRADDGAGNMVKSRVVRNNKYIINISKVNGDGYPTLAQAKVAEEVNMEYEVIVWNMNMDDGIIYGTQSVQLGRDLNEGLDRQAVLYRQSGSTDAILFKTNIPLANFVLSLDNGGAFPNPADPTVIANDLFSVAIKTDTDGNNYFEFTALQPYSAAATDNPSTLTVTAGRIEFSISITQRDFDPKDWADGGAIDGNF